jgi:hypothetical protein
VASTMSAAVWSTTRLVAAVAVVVLLITPTAPRVTAAQYSPPWAHAFRAHWPGTGGLDTTNTMNLAKQGLEPEYKASSINPASAKASMLTYAVHDAIWWMAGHAGTGFITTYNATNGTTVVNVSNQVPGSSCAGKNACLTDYTFEEMHDIRVMVFQGCDSGKTLANGDALHKRAKQVLGVDASVAFGAIIYFSANTSDVWSFHFANYGRLPTTVLGAAYYSAEDVLFYSGSYHGYKQYSVYGGSTYFFPAAYGS